MNKGRDTTIIIVINKMFANYTKVVEIESAKRKWYMARRGFSIIKIELEDDYRVFWWGEKKKYYSYGQIILIFFPCRIYRRERGIQ